MTQGEKIHDQSCVGAHSFACLKLYFLFSPSPRQKGNYLDVQQQFLQFHAANQQLLRWGKKKGTIDPPSARLRPSSEITFRKSFIMAVIQQPFIGDPLFFCTFSAQGETETNGLGWQKTRQNNQQDRGFCPLQGA